MTTAVILDVPDAPGPGAWQDCSGVGKSPLAAMVQVATLADEVRIETAASTAAGARVDWVIDVNGSDPSPKTITVPISQCRATRLGGSTAGLTVSLAPTNAGGFPGATGAAGPAGPAGDATPLVDGTGQDGAIVVDAGTTTLAGDLVCTSLHITSTGIFQSANFRVFCETAPVIDLGGQWICDGAPGVADAAGVAVPTGTLQGGADGGAGHLDAGDDGGNLVQSLSANGGAGAGASGGAGGTATIDPTQGRGPTMADAVLRGFSGGPGGGGGEGDGAVNPGGGGGSGAGQIQLWAPGLTNNGTISARGGDGGSPAAGAANGGGGGSGGTIWLMLDAPATGTGEILVDGGAGGAGGAGGGVAGSPGGVGKILAPP